MYLFRVIRVRRGQRYGFRFSLQNRLTRNQVITVNKLAHLGRRRASRRAQCVSTVSYTDYKNFTPHHSLSVHRAARTSARESPRAMAGPGSRYPEGEGLAQEHIFHMLPPPVFDHPIRTDTEVVSKYTRLANFALLLS